MKPHDEEPRKFEEFADLRRKWDWGKRCARRKLGSESYWLCILTIFYTHAIIKTAVLTAVEAAGKTLRLSSYLQGGRYG